jgi:UDP-glucose 4-epimerase
VPGAVLRGGAALSWRLRLQPTEPGWVDMGLGAPLMDTTRARMDLGWAPRHSAGDALLELLEGSGSGPASTRRRSPRSRAAPPGSASS